MSTFAHTPRADHSDNVRVINAEYRHGDTFTSTVHAPRRYCLIVAATDIRHCYARHAPPPADALQRTANKKSQLRVITTGTTTTIIQSTMAYQETVNIRVVMPFWHARQRMTACLFHFATTRRCPPPPASRRFAFRCSIFQCRTIRRHDDAASPLPRLR